MKKRLEELDILRVIGCIAVIIIHVTASTLIRYRPHSPHLKLAYIINTYTKFAVPLFIFISGIVLIHVYREKPLNFFKFMKSRLMSIGLPYLVWNLIYYLVFLKRGIYPPSPKFFIEHLIFGTMLYHFYFVVIIFQFYLLSNVWIYCFKRFNPTSILLISAIINFASMKYMYFKYSDRLFLNYLFFFILGCYFVTLKEKTMDTLYKYRGILYVLAIASGGLLTQQLYQAKVSRIRPLPFVDFLWYLYSCLAIIALYFAASAISKKYSGIVKQLKPIGDASFYIYLSHPLFLMVSIFIIKRLAIQSITVDTIFNLIFVSVTSIVFGILYINRNKIIGKLKLAIK